MLDENDAEENSASQEDASKELSNSTAADLGLTLSDEEEEPSSGQISSFSAAFANSKFSKNSECSQKSSGESTAEIDPLEMELRQMEERMQALKEQLSKKKKLNQGADAGTSKRFTKLTNISTESKSSVRTLTETEESNLYKKYGKKTIGHKGDTDSEDEEDERNPFEQKYNSCGREIKKRIAHEASQREQNKDYQIQRKREEVLSRVKTATTSQGPGWKGVDGSLVNLKQCGASKMVPEVVDKNVTVDFYSGIRIMNPLFTADVMRERMDGRKMVRMSSINLHVRCGEIEGDWVTIGVLVSKGEPRTSQKGSQYSIWKLSDLQDCTKTVALFLFSNAHKNLWKHSVGTVVGLLNPAIMKDRPGDKSTDILTLSLYDSNKAMIMGSSKDLGWCKGRTKTNGFCKYFVNKSSCEFCMYHIQKEYQKSSSKRADIQSSFDRVDPKRRLQERVLGKDQVFYGGQLYTAPSPANQQKQAKANKSKDLATLNSLKMKIKAQELKEEDKKNTFVLKHMSNTEIEAIRKVSQTSENFSEKLMAPTPGARNLLRHMSHGETERKIQSGEIRSVSAKDLLSMTHQQLQTNRNNIMGKSRLSVSPSQAKQMSLKSRLSVSPSAGPKLGRGLDPGNDIDLEISPPPNAAKFKAMALIQAKGGIQAAKPNAVKNIAKASRPEFQEKVRKRLSTDDENQARKKSRLSTVENEPSQSKLGSIDVNSEKFKAMMEQKSRHTNLVDAVENEALEKYYQGLEKKEMLEDKMASIMEIPTTAYVCIKCKYMAQSASDFCREEKHPLKAVKVKKRFFECKNCKRRTTSLDKLPRNPCSTCDHSSWQRVAMGKAKTGPKLDSEILSLRGDELDHYSGSSDKVYLHV
ncbi:protein MCM10 homolog isoform X2 [Palaemon carinicauda]